MRRKDLNLLRSGITKISNKIINYYVFYSNSVFNKVLRKVTEVNNIIPKKDGKAKPYQVKQVRNILLKYKLISE